MSTATNSHRRIDERDLLWNYEKLQEEESQIEAYYISALA